MAGKRDVEIAKEQLDRYIKEDKIIQLDPRTHEVIIRTKSRCSVENNVQILFDYIKELEGKNEKSDRLYNVIIRKLQKLSGNKSYYINGYYDTGAKMILEEILEEVYEEKV